MHQSFPEFEIKIIDSDMPCVGSCKHAHKYHTVKLKQTDGSYEMACARVDCSCMAFVDPELV